MTAKRHYDEHLAQFYSWMVGNFNEQQPRQEKYFHENRIFPESNRIAFDLGAGHGLQTISLAKLGFTVSAVDFSKQLLKELVSRQENLAIEIFENDMLNFLRNTSRQVELITCMGDTLTHLESMDEVADLLHEIAKHLEPRGKVVFSFRDLSSELRNEKRFIFVKGDQTKMLTCFLEYFPDHVMVHDIFYENQGGVWIKKRVRIPSCV